MGNLGIVITTVKGSKQYLPLLLQVLASTGSKTDIIVVDDGQIEASSVPLGESVKYTSTGLRFGGYAQAVNHGVRNLNGESYLAVLHDDIELPEDFSFQPFIDKMEIDETIGAIVPMLVKPRHTIVESFVSFVDLRGQQILKPEFSNWFPEYPPANEERYVDLLRSSFIFFRRSAFDGVSGYTENDTPCLFEDFDLSMKIKDAGYNLLYMPSIKAVHTVGATLLDSPELDLDEFAKVGLERFKTRWMDSSLICWRKEE
jgi:GT2 family glycosyltransferase